MAPEHAVVLGDRVQPAAGLEHADHLLESTSGVACNTWRLIARSNWASRNESFSASSRWNRARSPRCAFFAQARSRCDSSRSTPVNAAFGYSCASLKMLSPMPQPTSRMRLGGGCRAKMGCSCGQMASICAARLRTIEVGQRLPGDLLEPLLADQSRRREDAQGYGRLQREAGQGGHHARGEGLKPSKFGKRVKFAGAKRAVTDGPFAETKELSAGYWLWQVKSMDEAVEWVKRCPNPMPNSDSEIEIRPLYKTEDFAAADPTGEIRKQENELRKSIEQQQRR